MSNLRIEEKLIKRYLKTAVSINTETLVKFLITGTVALTLTACGGGGGGSSSPVPQDQVKVDQVVVAGNLIDVSYTLKADGTISSEVVLNGIKAEFLGKNSLLILDKNIESNGYKLEGITITNNNGIFTFSKEGKEISVQKGKDGNYHLTYGGYNYYLNNKGELISNDLPTLDGGSLPEFGLDKNWDLLNSYEIKFEKLEELRAEGKEVIHNEGKYYVLDRENKTVYELIIDTTSGEEQFSPTPEIDSDWGLVSSHEITVSKLKELKKDDVDIIEYEGKYYVIDKNNKHFYILNLIEENRTESVFIGNKEVEVKYTIGIDEVIKKEIELNGIKATIINEKEILITDKDYVQNGHNLEGVTISEEDGSYKFNRENLPELVLRKTKEGYIINHDGQNYVIANDGYVDTKQLLDFISKGLVFDENIGEFKINSTIADSVGKVLHGINRETYVKGLKEGGIKEGNISSLEKINTTKSEVSSNVDKELFLYKLSQLDNIFENSKLDSTKSHLQVYNELLDRANTNFRGYDIIRNTGAIEGVQEGNSNEILLNTGLITKGYQKTDNGIAVNYGTIENHNISQTVYGQRSIGKKQGELYNYGIIDIFSYYSFAQGQIGESENNKLYNYGSLHINGDMYSTVGQESWGVSSELYNYGTISMKGEKNLLDKKW